MAMAHLNTTFDAIDACLRWISKRHKQSRIVGYRPDRALLAPEFAVWGPPNDSLVGIPCAAGYRQPIETTNQFARIKL